MSRTVLALSLVSLAAPAVAVTEPLLATYHKLTRVSVKCSAPDGSGDIIICGRRAADRWRLPLRVPEAGDPRRETVSGERNRLASEPPQPCGTGAFLKNCGMVGVSAGYVIGGPRVEYRPLAP
jgi:hypothetical protein